MRFTLFTLALGTFLLTGCADDLTGPEASFTSAERVEADDLSSARLPEAYRHPVDADDMLFASWVGGNEKTYAFDFAFERAAVDASLDFHAVSNRLHFEGKGSYEFFGSKHPCKIVDGVYEDGLIRFDIADKTGVVATFTGAFSADNTAFKAAMKHADGSTRLVRFDRKEAGIVAVK
jgi:hypothetical protein